MAYAGFHGHIQPEYDHPPTSSGGNREVYNAGIESQPQEMVMERHTGPYGPGEDRPKDYLVYNIIMIFVYCPLGAIGTMYAMRCRKAIKRGQRMKARRYSIEARDYAATALFMSVFSGMLAVAFFTYIASMISLVRALIGLA